MSGPQVAGRRVTQTSFGHTISVCPLRPMPYAEWSLWFERRALVNGYVAVINGEVIYPGTPEAAAALVKVPA